MKLLHTSDWHLGALDGDRSLLVDQKFFIDGICDIATERSVDAVIIALVLLAAKTSKNLQWVDDEACAPAAEDHAEDIR